MTIPPTPAQIANADQNIAWANRIVDTLVSHFQDDQRRGHHRFIAIGLAVADVVAVESVANRDDDGTTVALALAAAAIGQLADVARLADEESR